MKQTFTKLLIAARKKAGYTQEGAAERMNISRRAMADYEQGVRKPPDDVMIQMVKLYGSRYLGYAWLRESAVGRFILADIEPKAGLAATVMCISTALKKAAIVYDRLEEIACDEVVDASEEEDFDRCWHELDELKKSIQKLDFSQKGTHSSRGRKKWA